MSLSSRAAALAITLSLTFACPRAERQQSWRIVSVADVPESTATVIRFANGRVLRLPLRDATVHEVLRGTEEVPWLLVSGWGCTDCDIEESVSAVRADTVLGEKWIPSYAYPGNHISSEDNSPFFRSRLFVGQCVPGLPRSATWLQEGRDSAGNWHRSTHMLIPRTHLVDSQFPVTSGLQATVLEAATGAGCREIAGKDQYVF